MKFCVNNKEMAVSIAPAVVVAIDASVKDFPYKDLITIKAEDNGIVVLSYGGTSSLKSIISDSNFSSLKYECKKKGCATVNALNLRDSLLTMESGDVEVSLSSGELMVTLLSDKSSKRSMGVVSTEVELPNFGSEFEQEVEIRKEVFQRGVDDVSFAPADEEKMQNYMCMLMETSEA